MKQSRVPDRVKRLKEVNRCQNGSVWRFFLLEAVPDWLRQSKNLVERRPTRMKAGLASGEEMICFEVKSWRERIKRSKSLEMQEVREMGRKEDGEEVSFPGLWMGMIVVRFQQEGRCESTRTCWKEKKGEVVLAQANALVKDRQSGQGQTQWKRWVCRWQWRVQPRRGGRKNCGGKKHPHS